MDDFAQDFRYGLRTLWKRKGFTLSVVLTLALALGTTTTLFSIVSAVLYTPLPFEHPDEIVFVWSRNDSLSRVRAPISLPDFVDLRREQTSFEDLAAMTATVYTLTGPSEPAYVQGYRVSSSFFPLTGVEMTLGRSFDPGAERVALLSHSAWERRFGADPEIVGQEIVLDGVSHTVIGVLATDVEVGVFERAELWTPLAIDPARASREARTLWVIGRLLPGATFDQAAAEIETLSDRFADSHPETNAGWTIFAQTLAEAMVGPSARAAFLLLVLTVLFVMAIACANVAHMLMARSEDRRREIAVRTALGASRLRLVRQLLTEATVLSIGAGALGLVLTQWTMRALVWLTRAQVPLVTQLSIDEKALAFALTLVLLTPILFALIPALRTVRADVDQRVQGVRSRSRFLLVAGEVAMALVLLVVAGLTVRSVKALRDIELGFDSANVLTMRVDLPPARYQDAARMRAFFDSLAVETRALPGVRDVGLSSHLPIVGSGPNLSLLIEGRPASDEGALAWVAAITASPTFFSTLRVPLLEGRIFAPSEPSPVALVSRAARDRYWAGDSPIGERIRLGEMSRQWITIVGVVGDLRNPDADQPPEPHVYLPFSQNPALAMALLVRAELPLAVAPSIREKVIELDPMQPVHDVRTMDQIVYDDLTGSFALAGLMGYFTLIALALATTGIFGVASHSVTARSRELGVRMALGARAEDVAWMVLRQALVPIASGLLLGGVAALGLSRLMGSMIYGISATDPATYGSVSLLLAGVAFTASLVPALRAARSDPLVTLRHQ